MDTQHPTRRFVTALLAAALPLLGSPAHAGIAAHPLPRTPVVLRLAPLLLPAMGEAAPKSRLPGFEGWEMPDGSRLLAETATIQELTAQLKDYAKENNLTLATTEALVWTNAGRDDYHNKDTEIGLQATFQGAGFTYRDSGEQGGTGYRFVARGSGGRAAAGIWAVYDGYLVLVWGGTAQETMPPTAAPSVAAGKDILPPSGGNGGSQAAPGGTGRRIAPPASLVGGTWNWTTIGGVGYSSTVTGQMAEPSGMSARFTFTPNGRYTYFFYVRQRTYGMVSESTTTESGTVAFRDDGTFTMIPSHGHYKGNTGSRLIDRDMTSAERAPKTFHWEWRTEGGHRSLYLGPDASSARLFKRG